LKICKVPTKRVQEAVPIILEAVLIIFGAQKVHAGCF
jgi:hypothetical protein